MRKKHHSFHTTMATTPTPTGAAQANSGTWSAFLKVRFPLASSVHATDQLTNNPPSPSPPSAATSPP